MEIVGAQVEEERVGELDFGEVAAVFVGGVGEDGERELKAFRFVDGHQLDGARVGRVSGGFTFAQTNVAQSLDVGEEIGQADEA